MVAAGAFGSPAKGLAFRRALCFDHPRRVLRDRPDRHRQRMDTGERRRRYRSQRFSLSVILFIFVSEVIVMIILQFLVVCLALVGAYKIYEWIKYPDCSTKEMFEYKQSAERFALFTAYSEDAEKIPKKSLSTYVLNYYRYQVKCEVKPKEHIGEMKSLYDLAAFRRSIESGIYDFGDRKFTLSGYLLPTGFYPSFGIFPNVVDPQELPFPKEYIFADSDMDKFPERYRNLKFSDCTFFFDSHSENDKKFLSAALKAFEERRKEKPYIFVRLSVRFLVYDSNVYLKDIDVLYSENDSIQIT